MRTLKTMKPGQKGTMEQSTRFGPSLLLVRYRGWSSHTTIVIPARFLCLCRGLQLESRVPSFHALLPPADLQRHPPRR